MSIDRFSATQIKNAGLKYISTPQEIAEALGIIGGPEAVGLWVLMLGNAPGYQIIKGVTCSKYRISERSFTRCMRSMEQLDLAWMETLPSNGGKFGGKQWCVSNMPRSVQDQLDSAVNKAKSMAEDVIKNNEMTPTPSKVQGRTDVSRDVSPTPAKLPMSAKNRGSVNCGDITKYQSIKQSTNTTSASELTMDWQPNPVKMALVRKTNLMTDDYFEKVLHEFKIKCVDSGEINSNWDGSFAGYLKKCHTKALGKSGNEDPRTYKHQTEQLKSQTPNTVPVAEIVDAWNKVFPYKQESTNLIASCLDQGSGKRIINAWNSLPEKLREVDFFSAIFQEIKNDEFYGSERFSLTLMTAMSENAFHKTKEKIVKPKRQSAA